MTESQLSALIRASATLVSSLDERTVIHRIIKEATKVLQAESCAVILLDDVFDECFFYSATGPHVEALQKIRFKKGLGIAGRVLESGEPAIVASADTDPDHYSGVDKKTGVHTESLICVPLRAKQGTIGVLECVNKKGATSFSDTDLRLLALFSNFAAVAVSNARAFERCRTSAELLRIAADRGNYFLGESPAMKKVWNIIGKVARTNSTVLITGESGSGKEVVASTIHGQGPRRDKPYTCVNCAALDTNLLSSELFGHEKGAFTGAAARRAGRFELANTGTLFLDEIADADPAVQARLLRVLETQVFERLGGSETIKTDVRVIAATNRDLEEDAREGAFREDLFHRLNVVSIRVPPLRERREDIPGLLEFFSLRFGSEMNCAPVRFTDAAMRLLVDYAWPGNVRELRNFVERVTVLSESESVDVSEITELFPSMTRRSALELPSETGAARSDKSPDSLWEAEKLMIEQALGNCGWNQSKAARELGISRHHLRYRIKKFGIQLRPE